MYVQTSRLEGTTRDLVGLGRLDTERKLARDWISLWSFRGRLRASEWCVLGLQSARCELGVVFMWWRNFCRFLRRSSQCNSHACQGGYSGMLQCTGVCICRCVQDRRKIPSCREEHVLCNGRIGMAPHWTSSVCWILLPQVMPALGHIPTKRSHPQKLHPGLSCRI